MDSRSSADTFRRAPEPSASNRTSSKNGPRHHTQPSFPLGPAPSSSREAPLQNSNMERTSSRKANGSERGYASDLGYFDVLPAAPDVPRGSRSGPPVSYRDSYVDGNLVLEVEQSSKSFAARTGTAPDDVDTVMANSIALNRMPVIESRRQSQYNSVDQPQRSKYAPNKLPFTPVNPNTMQEPVRTNSTKQRARNHKPVQEAVNAKEVPRDDHLTMSPQVKSAASKSSASSPTDWAADRSPLQRLEVKLNDISKEEKRARVQEAEQRLRDSQALDTSRRTSQSTQLTIPRSSSKRDALSEGVAKHGKQVYERRRGSTQFSSDSSPVTLSNGLDKMATETVAQRKRNASDANGQILMDRSPSQMINQPVPSKTRIQSTMKTSNDTPRSEDRGVRFESDLHETHSSENSQHDEFRTKNRSLNGPLDQKSTKKHDMTSNKLGSGTVDEQTADRLGVTDPVPPQAVKSHNRALKYEVPPQTAAGIDTRQRIGFGSRVDGAVNVPANHRHHFSDMLHHSRHDKQASGDPQVAPLRHLDEWRKGGTARLTLSDLVMDTRPLEQERKKAWWEEPKSASQRRRSRIEPDKDDFVPSDGTYEENNGTQVFPLHRRASSIATARDTIDPVRARQYIGYEGTTRVRRRNRKFRHEHESIMGSYTESGLQRTPSSFYSYTCPHLSQHDPLHRSHICQPYLSKGLIKSMRCIRVRFPADPVAFSPPLLLKCGPLLRYTGLRRDKIDQPSRRGIITVERETWRGSVMIVTTDAQSQYAPVPTLRFFHQPMKLLPPPPQQIDGESGDELPSEYVDPIAGLPRLTRTGGTVYVKPVEDLEEGKDVSKIENDDGLYEETRTANVPTSYGKADELLGRSPLLSLSRNTSGQQERQRSGRPREVKGTRLHAERGVTFWRFNLEVELGDKQARIAYKINKGASVGFWVPARGQTMNIMFHSCNGFSMSVDPNGFSGPDPLWRDVMNAHQTKPFHVMLGGGDQIYNDAVMEQTKLFHEWLQIKNPLHKHEAEFTLEMQLELETFYLERYSMWFSQGLFGMANSQIPMINIWDDHDIIDGFGSYPHRFMSTPVFCGLGNIAFKYYMLFQHQSVVDELTSDEPSWLMGASPGPYINELSRSVFMFLGKKVAFLGLDCRTERMREEILSEASYDLVFDRCRREIVKGETKHLIVLLGVPIAYPRLVWLENVLTSRALDPLKALGRMGLLGNFMNKFDGGVEILDDLDDHWTAKNHKDERNWFIEELQELAAEKSVRITILGGDVHLAAIGQFYSNKKLDIPKDQDFRYMPNVVSSAIVNTPPPDMMADVLNKRNKIHHLNAETDEDMIPMFTHDVDGKPRNNKRLLPKRNWCSIIEYLPGSTPPPTPSTRSPTASEESLPPPTPGRIQRTLSLTRGDSKPAKLIRRFSLSQRTPTNSDHPPASPYSLRTPKFSLLSNPNERFVGNSSDPATTPRLTSAPLPVRPISNFHRRPTNLSEKAAAKGGATGAHVDLEHGLDIKLNCEIKQGDPSGSTETYRLLVPSLFYDGELPQHRPRKQSIFQRIGSMRASKAAAKQGEGNYGQSDNETNSETDSDGERGGLTRFFTAPAMRSTAGNQQIRAPEKHPTSFQPRPQAGLQVESQEQHRPSNPSDDKIRSPIQQPGPISHNTTSALESEEDSVDELDELHVPRKRAGSKFDAGGRSKFFGAGPGVGSGPNEMAGGGVSRDSKPGIGWSGIDAYQEKKGWRKFF